MKIKIIDFGGKMPFRAHANDAGADVYATENLYLRAHSIRKMPLGIGLELPDGFMGIIMPRSGQTVKGLISHLPPIDSGYKGEIHAMLHNTTNGDMKIKKGDRVAQLVILPIIIADFITEEIEQRGTGAFGSTGGM